jgi:16S rRNA (uracil1498-N3)-methyltransferase
MTDRYFSADPIEGPTARLTGSDAHHLLHVMRAAPGLEVVLFDGRGGEFPAEVTRCGRAEVELAIGTRHDVERELSFELTLAAPLPKGDRQRWLVEKAVELGVSRLIPVKTAHSERSRDDAASKLHRYVIEASKQCGRNRLMKILPAISWSALLDEPGERRIVAHPGGRPWGQVATNAATNTILAVGPEGGLADEEIAAAASRQWQVVGLGDRILRVETAALALVARMVVE